MFLSYAQSERQAPVSNWKHRVFVKGNSLLDNIAFEEWSLKGLDKDLGPKLWKPKKESNASTEQNQGNTESGQSGLVSLNSHCSSRGAAQN